MIGMTTETKWPSPGVGEAFAKRRAANKDRAAQRRKDYQARIKAGESVRDIAQAERITTQAVYLVLNRL